MVSSRRRQMGHLFAVQNMATLPLERPKCRWEHNIKMDLKDTVCDAENWIDPAQVMLNDEHT